MVTIELELDAGSIVDDLAAIRAALQMLDDTGKDINIGENIDADSITGEIGQIINKLEELDNKHQNVVRRLNERFSNLDSTHEMDFLVRGVDGPLTGSGEGGGVDPGDQTLNFNTLLADYIDDDELSRDDSGPNYINPDDRRSMSDIVGLHEEALGKRFDFDDIRVTRDDSIFTDWESYSDFNSLKQDANWLGVDQSDNPRKPELIRRARVMETLKNLEHLDVSVEHEKLGRVPFQYARDADNMRYEAPKLDLPDLGEGQFKGDSDNPLINYATTFGKKRGVRDSMQLFSDKIGDASDELFRRLSVFKPSMRQIRSIVAAILPVLVAFGTQLLGVAAAMSAVAVAGAAMIGLGLIGHGENMAESFAQAKREMRELKAETFQAIQPTAEEFAPIQERIFDAIPGAVGEIAGSMTGLKGFEGTLFQMGSDLTGGIKEFFEIINRNQSVISELAIRFGRITGSNLLRFFEWLIVTASKNQRLIIKLGQSLREFLVIIFNVSMIIARMAAGLEPLFRILEWVSRVMNNRLIGALIAFIGVSGIVTVMTAKMTMGFLALSGAVIKFMAIVTWMGRGKILEGIIVFFLALKSHIGALIGELTILQTLLAGTLGLLAGLGLIFGLTAGGLAAYGALKGTATPDMGGNDSNVYNDNREYTINQGSDDYASRKSVEDTMFKLSEAEKAQDVPDVTLNDTNG